MSQAQATTTGTDDVAVDWKVTNFDPFTCAAPTVEAEVRRLQALKSYGMLDRRSTDACYHDAVRKTFEIFQVPAVLTLVDLERCVVVAASSSSSSSSCCSSSASNSFGKNKTSPRKDNFCAHTILVQGKTLLVNDASKDRRFAHLSCVTGPPHVKFYVGAPLIATSDDSDDDDGDDNKTSKSVHKIGALSLVSSSKRNWTDQESDLLVQLAEIIMNLMESRRKVLRAQEVAAKAAAVPAVPPSILVSPKTSQPSLQFTTTAEQPVQDALEKAASVVSQDDAAAAAATERSMVGSQTTVQIFAFAKILEDVMQSVPHKVDLLFIVAPNLPANLYFQDLYVFRSAVSMISSACERTEKGQICLTIYQSPRQDGKVQLVFECEDTSPDPNSSSPTAAAAGEALPQHHQHGHQSSGVIEQQRKRKNGSWDDNNNNNDNSIPVTRTNMCGAIVQHIASIPGGEFGCRRRFKDNDYQKRTGFTVWFSVPLQLPPPSQPPRRSTNSSSSCCFGTTSTPATTSGVLFDASKTACLSSFDGSKAA